MKTIHQGITRKVSLLILLVAFTTALFLGAYDIKSINFGSDERLGFVASAEQGPDHLNYSTFIGGSGAEYRTNSEDLGTCGLAVDSSGNIIVVGRTGSTTDFPVINAYQDSFGGGSADAFIYKLSSDGQTLLFASYLGGSDSDWATDVAVNAAGEIAVVGTTMSTDFPLASAYQGTNNGGDFYSTDIFLAKFSSSGSLVFSTFIGGTGDDWGYGVDFDSNGKIAITGSTYSLDFPVLSAYQSTKTAGSVDTYVTVVAANGQSLVFSTYLGSTGNDGGSRVKFDANNDLAVTGLTSSAGFPTKNAYDATYNSGAYDNFVSKFFANASLAFSTFLGGTDADRGYDLAFDSSQNIVVVGSTNSIYNFPITGQAQQADYGGGPMDGSISQFSPTGQLLYSSFYGGSKKDEIFGVATNSEDVFAITGSTESIDLPVLHAYQSLSLGGTTSSFVAQGFLNGTMLYSTYLSGGSTDIGRQVVFTSADNMVVSGATTSANFPMKDAYQATLGGSYDTFVTIFNLDLTIPTTNNSPAISYISCFAILTILLFVQVTIKARYTKKK